MNVNEYFHMGNPDKPIMMEATKQVPTMKNYPDQGSDPVSGISDNQLMDALNTFTGMRFDSVGDFLGYYQGNYFQTAYTQLKPFTCHQLAIGNPYITSAIDAIADPIASANIIATPTTPETNPNQMEINYLQYLLNHPNPLQPKDIFIKLLLTDALQTGSAYIEVGYNSYGFAARLDRVAPYLISAKKVSGKIYFVRTDNGYVFPDNAIIPIFSANPYSDYKGLTKLIPLFTNILTDTALMEHNLRYFVKDTLKSIISVSDKVTTEGYVNELEVIKQQIKEMENKGDSGHLIMHGATVQGLSQTNQEMMTPDIWKANIDAICAVYHVPPHKVMKVESGNLGTGTGESQEDAMNETINNNAKWLLSYLNFKLTDFMGIESTIATFDDLTKTDDVRQAQLDTIQLDAGITDVNSIRVRDGLQPYDNPLLNEPWKGVKVLPLSMTGLQYTSKASVAGESNVTPEDTDPLVGDITKEEMLSMDGVTFNERLKQARDVKHFLRKLGYAN